jgi:preprotein translocase subunit SecY
MQKEGGEEGKEKLNKITRYSTVVLAAIQAIGIIAGLNSQVDEVSGQRVLEAGYNNFFGLLSIGMVMAAGTSLAMWIGERVTKNGIGNGISLLIFAGIISNLFSGILTAFTDVLGITRYGTTITGFLILIVTALVVITVVTFVDLGERRIPVQYAKRVVGRKMYGGQSSHIPMKVNQAGVIPVIFAISLLQLPMTAAYMWPESGFASFVTKYLSPSGYPGVWIYFLMNMVLIMFFTYFYSSVSFNPVEIADNMKSNGGFIPGIRPGRPTVDYISKVMSRLTFVSAIFLTIIASIPTLIQHWSSLQIGFGGTSVIIAVGVALDTMKQLETQMIMRNYSGFLK